MSQEEQRLGNIIMSMAISQRSEMVYGMLIKLMKEQEAELQEKRARVMELIADDDEKHGGTSSLAIITLVLDLATTAVMTFYNDNVGSVDEDTGNTVSVSEAYIDSMATAHAICRCLLSSAKACLNEAVEQVSASTESAATA